MYAIGDRVVYGVHGVCTVVGVEQRRVDKKTVEYFALESLDRPGSRFYVPTHNEVALSKMRPLLSPERLQELLTSAPVDATVWVEHEGLRKTRYKELLAGGDRSALLSMLVCLYRYKEDLLSQGRKFHMSDENFLWEAEKLFISEISYVLNMNHGQAGEYLRQCICVSR